MSIPLDRLYNYINSLAQNVCKDNVIIYRFYPHGSKNIEDLTHILPPQSGEEEIMSPQVMCHDQEPLEYERYEKINPIPDHKRLYLSIEERRLSRQIYFNKLNLRDNPLNIYDHAVIVHSELRSIDVQKYIDNHFIPVYYWFHGLISLDWYRYANYIQQTKKVKHTFLIYNRAWSGTREYRLKFSELLIRLDLHRSCNTFCNPVDLSTNQHYNDYQFNNTKWKPLLEIERFFPESGATSDFSGDFDLDDYESSDIEIVLETLFDDQRLHLTEKTLRPMALGQPFILASTHGSLEYLRSYGFKTYNNVWNEDYDIEPNAAARLLKIIKLMKSIVDWTPAERKLKMAEAEAIADYNKKHFFSQRFQDQLLQELKSNLTKSLIEVETTNTGLQFINRRKTLLKNSEYRRHSIQTKSYDKIGRINLARQLKKARQYKLRSLSKD